MISSSLELPQNSLVSLRAEFSSVLSVSHLQRRQKNIKSDVSLILFSWAVQTKQEAIRPSNHQSRQKTPLSWEYRRNQSVQFCFIKDSLGVSETNRYDMRSSSTVSFFVLLSVIGIGKSSIIALNWATFHFFRRSFFWTKGICFHAGSSLRCYSEIGLEKGETPEDITQCVASVKQCMKTVVSKLYSNTRYWYTKT